MDRQAAIAILQSHADMLRARGVRHAALFGSVARGDAGPESDIDILIELEPGVALDIFAYAELKSDIADLFPSRVDVINRDTLKPYLRKPAARDTVYAF
jgi:predicted nucleotidyltransferase